MVGLRPHHGCLCGRCGLGFLAAIRNAPLGFSRRIPLHIAARRAYEAAEKAGILHLTTSETASPEDKLFHFKLLFMVDDETELFGIKPPSTKSLRIPTSELQGRDFYPAGGDSSQLNHLIPKDRVAYTDVTEHRRDLRRVISSYIAEARRIKS